MTPAPSLTDLTASLSLGTSAVALIALALCFADADLADFDPRPALARLVESGRLDWLLLAVGPALFAAREAARDAAALLILLTTRPTGALS